MMRRFEAFARGGSAASLARITAALFGAMAALAAAGCVSEPLDGAPVTPTLAQSGRMLAQRECARCHAIGEFGGSPRADAPPLRDMLRDVGSGRIRAAFEEGMMIGHMDMPIYDLSDAETDALLAYLEQIEGWSGRSEPGSSSSP